MKDKAKWGYLAAMIDGEGFISVVKGSKPAPNGNGYITAAPRYGIVVSVTGTNENLMQWLIANFGGSWTRDKSQNPLWKQRVSWRSTGSKNKEIVLLGIMPYLIIKKQQAVLALEFLRMNGESNPTKRESIHLRMKELNKRGKAVEANTLDPTGPVRSTQWRHAPNQIEPVLAGMTESELIGNDESAPQVTEAA
jgi:hypothetical protein